MPTLMKFASFRNTVRDLPIAAGVQARGGTPRIAAVRVWARADPAAQREAERWLPKRNRAIHRVRPLIEKIFGTWKRSYGFRPMRWRGLTNAHLQARLTATAYNLTRTANLLAAG